MSYRSRIAVAACALSLATYLHAAQKDEVIDALTLGHPEVAELLRAHPEIVRHLQEPMWRDVVLKAPLIPGTGWRVHDLRRPQPATVAVDPAACRSAPPPADAIVIFDGSGLDEFVAGQARDAWRIENGELVASGRTNNHLATRRSFGDMQLHVEFATPVPAAGSWQFRGNSGVFLMDLYEIQILDSYQNPTYPDGQAAALYGQVPPLVNASLPPGNWQCYDILFAAPRFEGATLVAPARVTLMHNGVVVQRDVAFMGRTSFARIAPYSAHAQQLPFALQDHGDATSQVRFRNVWVRRLEPI